MSNTINEKAEKIKTNIKGTAEKSKETIREFIDSNTKNMDAVLDSNKKIFDSIKEKLNQNAIDDTVSDNLKQTFGKSIKLAEDAMDNIINSYTRQMELNVDFNTKLVDAVKESNTENPEKILTLIHENAKASQELSMKNTKEILDFYNKHTNLTLNFNEKFGENVKAQIESMYAMQNKGLNRFTDWASEWWKQETV